MKAKKNSYQIAGDIATLTITKLNGEEFACLIDASDVDAVSHKTWGVTYDPSAGSHYVHNSWRVDGKTKTISIHRFLTGAQGYEQKVDHINHDTLDNRRSNLRIVSNAVNTSNRAGASKTNKSSGIRGVSWEASHNSWKAHAGFNGRKLNLGRYKDKFEAERVVKAFWSSTGRMPEAPLEVCHR